MHDLAEKVKLYFDGREVPGLVSIAEIVLEKGMIEVPEFHRIRQLQNGITKVPVLECVYKIARNSETLKFFKDWYFNDEVKDVSKVRTDAHGVEFARTLFPGAECAKFSEPAFDGANPTYAQAAIRLVPWDYVPIEG